ncbi:MAG: energy transducer TonB [Methylotenera sp.]
MIRKHENSDSWKAGIYAIAVHLALLAGMLISFNWKAAHPVLNVTEVELWDKLPSTPPVIKEPPKPEEPKAVIEPKPEEPKPVVEEKPKPEEPKVDIELEKKKKELEQKELAQKQKELDEQRKKEALEKIKQDTRAEIEREKKAEEKQAKLERDKALRKLKEDMLNDNGADDAKAASAANASLIGEYTEKIKAKIRGNVNKTLCGDGNPELRFEISVLPTGQLSGSPKIVKSSEISACDEAVERAIIASEPLPLPDDPSLKSQFKNLKLKFRPND